MQCKEYKKDINGYITKKAHLKVNNNYNKWKKLN